MIPYLWNKVKTVRRASLKSVEVKHQPQINRKCKQDARVDVDEIYEKYATVSEVFEDLVVLKCSDNVNCTTPVDKFKWKPLKGDKVRVRFLGGEDSFKDVDMEVHTLAAVNSKTEFGRVTAMESSAIVFENKIVYFPDGSKQFNLSDELEYTTIESSQEIGDSTFDRRIIEIFSFVFSERIDILMEDVHYSVVSSRSDVISKTINIFNNSNVKLKVEKCSIDPENDFVKLQQTTRQKENFMLFERSGKYHAVLKIFPRALGTHEVTFVVDFITPKSLKVQKKCKITLEVFTRNNVISGPRPSPIIRFTDISINQYEVPAQLRLIDFVETKSTLEVLKEKFSFLSEEISALNYRDKIHLETFIEEMALEVAFKKYSMKRGRFENIEKDGKVEFMRLKVKDVAEKRPSIGIGDKIAASDPFRPSPEQLVFEGFIYKVEDDAVLVKPENDFHKSHHGKDFRIEFQFSRSSFRNFHHAVDTITSKTGLGYDFLFPKIGNIDAHDAKLTAELDNGRLKVFDKIVDWVDNKVNIYQKEAIVNILRGECRPLPYIIYGPPGTGKTMTVVELIMQLASLDPDAHLIVATPSNSAANIFTEKLASSGRFNEPHDFVRFVSHNQIEKNLIPEELRKYCATISIGSDNERHHNKASYTECGIRKNCTKSNILNYRVCIATLSCFGSLMKLKFPRDHFTHVIIDESGQSIEAESLIPMTLVSKTSGQVILAGDPKQLGPVMSTYSQHLKLDSSLLERLLTRNECYSQVYGPNKNEFDKRFVTKLKINYRSLPSILEVYNKLFYGNELEGVIKAQDSSEANLLGALQAVLWKGEKNEKCGIYFINVDGKNQKVSDSCSWHNEKEASAIKSLLWKLHQLGLSSKDIGVITPYALQVKKLKQLMSNLPDAELKIGTVEEFQGQEREIILISTVRTEKTHFVGDFKYGLGFLQCPKRMNVAISRARTLLVVFGKEDILTSFGGSTWKDLIKLTKENGTFFEND